MPVLEHYKGQGKVAEIDGSGTPEEVHKLASEVVNEVFAGKYPSTVSA